MALDILHSKIAVVQVIFIHPLPLGYISFPLLLSFLPELSQLFLSPSFPFFRSFFLSHEVPSPLSSPALCPSIMIVDLGFAKLFPSLSYFRIVLFESYK